jgi:putative sterol carrier protein
MVQLSSGKEKDASAAFKKSESIAKTLNPPSPDFIKWLRSDEFKEFVKEKGFVRLYSNGN